MKALEALEKYKKLGENWGYSDAITPLYIYENYIMERLTLDTNHDIPIFVNMKERDMRDYLYVKQALTEQEKVNELLELYRLKDKLQDDKMLATPKRRTATSHVKIAEINNKIYDIKDKIRKLESELNDNT